MITMCASGFTPLLLHGTRESRVGDLLAGGFVRESSAVFVVPRRTALVARVRLTLAISIFHAVGLDGWRSVLAEGQRSTLDRLAIFAAEPTHDSSVPPLPDHYVERTPAGDGATSFGYARVSEAGPISVRRALVTTIEWNELEALIANEDLVESPRFFVSMRRPVQRFEPLQTRGVCHALATEVMERWRRAGRADWLESSPVEGALANG